MIRVQGLTKRFGALTAVDDLSFDVARGETFALIGPNGAGKTTTLKLLLGLARPDAGRIEVGSERRAPHDPRARRALGYVPQRVEFPAGRTVAEVLRFYADLRALPASAVGCALERVALTALASRRASELSGGYTQRLSLAQALLGDPELLVLDEPTASLDPEATFEFRSLLGRLRAEGRTIVLSSHLLSEVERVADRVLILVDGRRAAVEPLAALRARQADATRLVIEAADAAQAMDVLTAAHVATEVAEGSRLVVDGHDGDGLRALEALHSAGVPVRSFELRRPTLEETFLDVVRGSRRDA